MLSEDVETMHKADWPASHQPELRVLRLPRGRAFLAAGCARSPQDNFVPSISIRAPRSGFDSVIFSLRSRVTTDFPCGFRFTELRGRNSAAERRTEARACASV